MLIDVQDLALNPILNTLFAAMAVVTIVSLIPWRLRQGKNRWSLWLPLLMTILYAGYEMFMPVRMNIRLDLVLIWPFLLICFFAWGIRIVLIRRL